MFSKLQKRILIVAGSLAIGYAVAFDGIYNRLTPQKLSIKAPFSSRGPFAGRKVGDCWVADEAKSRFLAGNGVTWQMHADLPPNTAMIVDTELWCGDQPIQIEEARLSSAAFANGWQSFGVVIPRDARGECHLDRQVELEDDAGSVLQKYDFRRPMNLIVDPG